MLLTMDLELLNCSICPKKPTFSDTSHLLTHVSSKGHLSHLHKLQVRSHQEIAAGVQLATYNQWYQHHGLGQLLSERLLLKEARSAGRRAAAAKRGATIAPAVPTVQPQQANSLPKRNARKRRLRDRQSLLSGDNSDSDFS